MNPLRITGEGYGRFDRFTIDIPTGITAIVGPNGAGKSRLLNTIELCLFAGRGELAQWLAPGHDRLLLELEFEHGGELFRVRRMYTAGTRAKQAVDFEHHIDALDAWEPLTREDAKATDQLICDTIGLSRATFGASAFLAQGNAAAFPDATAGERKQMLGEILDPHKLWPRLADRARAEAKEIEAELLRLVGQIGARDDLLGEKGTLEMDIQRLEIAADEARSQLAAAEERTEEAQQAVVANAAAAERVRTLDAQHEQARVGQERAQRDLRLAKEAEASLAAAERDLVELEQTAARVPDLERAFDAQRTARTEARSAEQQRRHELDIAAQLTATTGRLDEECGALDRQRQDLANQLTHLLGAAPGSERCGRCEQILGVEATKAAVASMATELEGFGDARLAKKVALEEARQLAGQARRRAAEVVVPDVPEGDFETGLVAARAAAEQVAASRVRIEQWRLVAATVAELERTLALRTAELDLAAGELASADAPDTAGLDRLLAEAKGRVATCRTALDAATHDLTRARQQLEQLDDALRERDALTRDRDRRQADLDVVKLAERAFGRDGIPALIAENAIPQIETEANRILELMPTAKGETLRVELRTQRELKSADHLKETLDILVADTHAPRPYETYSGGEHGRVNVALRLALARLLATGRGADSRVLVLDEVPYLDRLGEEQLVEVVRGVEGTYERVLVVAHTDLRDAFEQVIEVASDPDGVSFLAAARASLEAVV